MNELTNTNVNEALQKEIKKVEKVAKGRQVLFPVVNGEKVESKELTFEFYDKVNKMYDGVKAPSKKLMNTYSLEDINIGDVIYKQNHICATFKNMVYTQLYTSLSAIVNKYRMMALGDQSVKAEFDTLDDLREEEEFKYRRRGTEFEMTVNNIFGIPYYVDRLGDYLDYRHPDDDDSISYLISIVDINSYFIGDITLIENYTASFTSYIYKHLKERAVRELIFDCGPNENQIYSRIFLLFNEYIEKMISEVYDEMYKVISEAYVLANKYREAGTYGIRGMISEKIADQLIVALEDDLEEK